MEIIRTAITALIRHALTFIGGILVSKGIIDPSSSEALVTGLVALAVSLVSMVISKYWQKQEVEEKVDVALALPEGSTKRDLNEALQDIK